MVSSQNQAENEDVRLEESDSETEEVTPCSNSRTGKRRKRNPGTSEASSPIPVKKIQTRSDVWEHFTRFVKDENKCKCHYCGSVMSYKTTSGTSNLQQHLRNACKQYKVWVSDKGKQQAITHDGHLKLAKVSEAVVREATNELMVMAELPLSFVECMPWRYFCERVNFYNPISRRTANRDIVQLYVRKKEAMRNIFRNTRQRVSLTTDIWTAPTTRAIYMVITAHFINESWTLKKFIIGFKHILDHKGSTIASVLLQCLADWGIVKIFTITVDNATANSLALSKFIEQFRELGGDAVILDGKFLHMSCAAHILNLVVKDGMHEVTKSVQAVRNGIQYIRASTNRMDSFEQKVEPDKNVSRGSLSLDCKTRWNSTYLMLKKALKYKDAFDRMEAEDKLYNEFFFEVDKDGKPRAGPADATDWVAIDRLVQFLHIFYHSTLVVSASSSLNAHKCYSEICTIEKNLIRLSNSPDLGMQTKAKNMRDKFDKYWEGVKEINRLVIIASVFDPTKKMQFAQHSFDKLYGKDNVVGKQIHASVTSVMKSLFDAYNIIINGPQVQSQATSSSHSHAQSQNQSGQESDINEMDSEVVKGYERMDFEYNDMVQQKGTHDASNELELYLMEPVENPNLMLGTEYDVLGYWRFNSPKFPILSTIARDVLAVQVSSVASKSAFSTSGRILDPYRSCLTHSTLEVLMCTEQWLKCSIHLNDKGLFTISDVLGGDVDVQDKLQKEFGL